VRSAAAFLPFLFVSTVTALFSQSPPAASPTARFLAAPPALQSYRAWRRLEASNARFGQSGWLEVITELGPRGFEYRIEGEGGSARIRRRVLVAALDGERELVGDTSAMMTEANYAFVDDGIEAGLARIKLTPKRKHRALVDGYLFVTPESADLVEVTGRLVTMPSFWVTRVEVTRRYGRIGGVRVPVSTDSTANVRFAGRSVFTMRYVYQSINGHPIGG
jgi:hypothetical protein